MPHFSYPTTIHTSPSLHHAVITSLAMAGAHHGQANHLLELMYYKAYYGIGVNHSQLVTFVK